MPVGSSAKNRLKVLEMGERERGKELRVQKLPFCANYNFYTIFNFNSSFISTPVNYYQKQTPYTQFLIVLPLIFVPGVKQQVVLEFTTCPAYLHLASLIISRMSFTFVLYL